MRGLKDKVALVTGGASGIGRATVLRLAEEGVAVAVADITEDAGNQVVEEVAGAGGRAVYVEADVGDAEAVERMVARTVEEFGGLDILHNNAALQAPSVMERDDAIVDFDSDLFGRVTDVNLIGPVLGCKYAIPAMLDRGGGSIVNTSSLAALTGTGKPMYGMTKAALIAFSRYVATQYGKQGIRCNAVAPGIIVTPAMLANNPDPAQRAAMEDKVLGPRLGVPEDIASAVVFLASDDSAYITAQLIVVDGGRLSHG